MAVCLGDVAWSGRRERAVRTVGLPAHDRTTPVRYGPPHMGVTLLAPSSASATPGRPAKIAVCDTPGFTIRPEVNRGVSFSTILSIARTGRCSRGGRQTTPGRYTQRRVIKPKRRTITARSLHPG